MVAADMVGRSVGWSSWLVSFGWIVVYVRFLKGFACKNVLVWF